VQYYNPRQLPALAKILRKAGGRHLVVGHSNTTPELAELLTGQPTPDIEEATEYDRLYIVTLDQHGTGDSVLLRYGNP
jgi:probable phosphoglycerate mutase